MSLSVPYVSRLEGDGFQPGQSLTIKGVPTGDRFVINLATAPNDEDALALHLSVRFDEKCIMLNTKDGGWGKEVKEKNALKQGENADIRIRAHDKNFQIFVGQKELCEFEYRVPIIRVSHVLIDGAFNLQSVVLGGKYHSVPFETALSSGFAPGKRLFVTDILEKKGKRYSLNLLTPQGDIALHLSIRFDEKCVVRNAQHGGSWGSEEKEGKLLLEKDHIVDITVVNEDYAFQVSFNGEHFCAFAHRADPNNINGLRIDGEVEVHDVRVK